MTTSASPSVRPSTVANPSAAALPTVAPWPNDYRWVYSITFDEGMRELHKFAVPILAEFGVPGHLEVVAGHIGVVRNLGASSYNGFFHMGFDELREMMARGWGVGCHTWTHELITSETVELEIGESKRVIDKGLGEPITIYCSAGDNENMSSFVLDACRRHGYLAAMSITDALNPPGSAAIDDLLWVNRTFLHTQGYGPFFSAFDPYRNLLYADRTQGWVIDYCHCPLEVAVHPNKDCSAAELRRRMEAVCEYGGDRVWLAKVEDVTDYRYTRRAAKVEAGGGAGEFTVSAPGLHPSVRRKVVTLELPRGTWAAEVDAKPTAITPRGGKLLIDVDLSKPRKLTLQIEKNVKV